MACTTINIKDPHLQKLISKFGQKEGMVKYLKTVESAYKYLSIPREFKESYDKLYKEYKQYADKAISYPTEKQAKLNAENLEKIFGKGNVSIVNKGNRNTSWLVVPIAPQLESEKDFEIRWNKELSDDVKLSNEVLENNLQYVEQLTDTPTNSEYITNLRLGLYKQLDRIKSISPDKHNVVIKELETILTKLQDLSTASGMFALKEYVVEMIGGYKVKVDGTDEYIERGKIQKKLEVLQEKQFTITPDTEEYDRFMSEFANFLYQASTMNSFFKSLLDIDTESLKNIENKVLLREITQLRKNLQNTHSLSLDLIKATSKFFRDKLTKLSTNPDVLKGTLDILQAQMDESIFQGNLDALADTHNTFVQILMKQYEVQMGLARKEDLQEQQEMKELFDELKKNGNNIEYYLQKIDGKTSTSLITEYNNDYKHEMFKLKDNMILAEKKYGTNSDEHLREVYKYRKWKNDNLTQKFNKIYYNFNSELEVKPNDSEAIKKKKWDAWKRVYLIDQEIKHIINDPEYTDSDGEFDNAKLTDEQWEKYQLLIQEKRNIKAQFQDKSKRSKDFKEIFDVKRDVPGFNKARDRAKDYSEYLRKTKGDYEADTYWNKWLMRNTKLSFTDDFWKEFKDIQEGWKDIKGTSSKKGEISIAYEGIKKRLDKAKVDGKLVLDKLSEQDREEIYTIQKYIYSILNKKKDKVKTAEVQSLLKRMDDLYSYIGTDEYEKIKAEKLATLSEEEYKQWFNKTHFENPNSKNEQDKYIPVAYYTELMPKQEKHIVKEDLNSRWLVYTPKQEYENTNEGIKLATELYNKAVKNNNADEQVRLKKILDNYDKDNIFRLDDNEYTLPKKQWKSKEFIDKKLADDKWYQKFTSKLGKLSEYTTSGIVHEGLLPGVPKSKTEGMNLKQRAGVTWERWVKLYQEGKNKLLTKDGQDIVKEITVDEQNRIINFVPFHYLRKLEQDNYIHPTGNETIEELEKMSKENERIYQENKLKHVEASSLNIEEVMSKFINTAVNFKYKKLMEAELLLAKEQLKLLEIKPEKASLLDKIGIHKMDIKKEVTIKGEQSNLYKHYTDWMKMVFYEDFEKDEGLLQDIVKALQDLTSFKAIGFNVYSGVNNMMIGKMQIFMESFAGTFFDRESYKAGKQMYDGKGYSNILEYIQERKNDTSRGTSDGLIKYFDIMQSQDELSGKHGGALVTKVHKLAWIKNAAYAIMHAGEHLMQNQSLFAMLHYNRVIDGRIYNEREYVDRMSIQYPDKTKEQLRVEFKAAPKLVDVYELHNGKIRIKLNYKLVRGEEENFRRKVIAVNQRLHGIYNKEHAGAVQQYALGRLGMQFRKHLRPMWNRRFGNRFWETNYNEHREVIEEGMYKSTGMFLIEMFRDYKHMYSNATKVWSTLSDEQKANIKRSLVELSMMITAFLLYMIVRSIKGKVPDDDKKTKMMLNYVLMQLDRIQVETSTFMPQGLFRESKALLNSPAAGLRTVTDIGNLGYQAMTYPFRPDKKALDLGFFKIDPKINTTGQYKDDTKLGVALWKFLPPLKFIQDTENLEWKAKYWKLF